MPAKVIKKNEMPDGSIVLELDSDASPPEYVELMRSVGLDIWDGCEITGSPNVQVFEPKVPGASPIVQRVGKPTITVRWKKT